LTHSASDIEKKRKKRNKELVKRMRQGETLSSFDAQLSFFPPRPLIEKDEKEVERLFKKKKLEKGERT